MRGKKLLAVSLALAMLAGVLVAGCGGSKPAAPAAEKPKLNFRLAEAHPGDYPTTMGDKKFAELVAQKSNGRINIKVFDSAQLGDENSVIQQVQLGSIEFTRISSGTLAEFNKQFGVFSLPYIFNDQEHVWRFLNGDFGQKMLTNLEKSRMIGLCYYEAGSRSFYTKKPVKSPEDLKGLKIRVIQNAVNIELMKAFGASATPMPYGEVFSALQTGVIDGAENNPPSYLTANHYQAVKNYVLDSHQRVPEVLMVSRVAWDKMSDEDKKIIQEAAKETVKYQIEVWNKFEKEALNKLIQNGVVVTEVKDMKPWQEAAKPAIDKLGGEFKAELDAIKAAAK